MEPVFATQEIHDHDLHGANVANSGVTAIFESQEFNEQLENTFAMFIDGVAGSSAHVLVDITGYYVPA